MSTPQTLWANRTLALLARLQRVGGIRAQWTDLGHDACAVTVQANDITATAVLTKDLLLRAAEAEAEAEASVLVVLSELLRSLPTSLSHNDRERRSASSQG
jgi:hypothetical protein